MPAHGNENLCRSIYQDPDLGDFRPSIWARAGRENRSQH